MDIVSIDFFPQIREEPKKTEGVFSKSHVSRRRPTGMHGKEAAAARCGSLHDLGPHQVDLNNAKIVQGR
jgi:hypothetical protein